MTPKEHYSLHPRFATMAALYEAYGQGHYRLDLGCGYAKPEGFIGLDDLSGEASQLPDAANAPDIFMDLNQQRLPFPDGSCDEVRASHFLEHSNMPHIIEEVHRVLRAGGTFLFAVPYANSAEGMYPGHTQFLTEKWFHENLTFQRLFTIDRERYFPSTYWQALPRLVRLAIPFNVARTFLFNACWQMMMWCSPKK